MIARYSVCKNEKTRTTASDYGARLKREGPAKRRAFITANPYYAESALWERVIE